MISIDEANKLNHLYNCARLGVDDFRVKNPYYKEEKYNGQSFFSPLIEWTIKNRKFTGIVPVAVKEVTVGKWIGKYKVLVEDNEKMEQEFMKMVEKSKSILEKS